jgi:transposase
MLVTRVYKLLAVPRFEKSEGIRYAATKFNHYVNLWLPKLFFNGNKSISTRNLGCLASQAQYKARGIIIALKAAQRITGNKINVPQVTNVGVPCKIQVSKGSSFNYWAGVGDQFKKYGKIKIPCNSHRKLNEALRNGWSLSQRGEVIKINSNWYVRVFVSKEAKAPEPKNDSLGIDVGYKYSVARSDSYMGKRLDKVIKKVRKSNSDRQRQGLHKKSVKTQVKQILDKEAKLTIQRCVTEGVNLFVESPKVVGNLCKRGLQGWASAYFANRCEVLAKESEVFIWQINPAYTSVTCSSCGHVDKQSRVNRDKFICTSCKSELHADVNAARNIALKGTASLGKYLSKRSGVVGDLPYGGRS